MSNGISGYNAGNVNPYRQLERRPDAAASVPSTNAADRAQNASNDRVDLATDLSDAEATMIQRQFPGSEQMKLRLYGPGSKEVTADPTARGLRLDLRG